MKLKNVLGMLRGKDKFETVENFSILFICLGALILSSGIGLTALSTRGIPAILAMLGAFVSFLSVVVLIFVWIVKEFFGD